MTEGRRIPTERRFVSLCLFGQPVYIISIRRIGQRGRICHLLSVRFWHFGIGLPRIRPPLPRRDLPMRSAFCTQ